MDNRFYPYFLRFLLKENINTAFKAISVDRTNDDIIWFEKFEMLQWIFLICQHVSVYFELTFINKNFKSWSNMVLYKAVVCLWDGIILPWRQNVWKSHSKVVLSSVSLNENTRNFQVLSYIMNFFLYLTYLQQLC